MLVAPESSVLVLVLLMLGRGHCGITFLFIVCSVFPPQTRCVSKDASAGEIKHL